MTALTLERAKTLTFGTILHHNYNKNYDGTPQRWKVNGKVKLWKRDPTRFRVPIKHGLYSYNCIDIDSYTQFMVD